MNARIIRSAASIVAVAVISVSAIASPQPPQVRTGAAVEPEHVKPYNADYNRSGSVETQDIFDYLTGWFAGKIDTDVNSNGVLEGLDILEYINAWFAAPAASSGK